MAMGHRRGGNDDGIDFRVCQHFVQTGGSRTICGTEACGDGGVSVMHQLSLAESLRAMQPA